MNFANILDTILRVVVPITFLVLILYLIIKRLNKTARLHLGMKRYVKQATKLDRKKHNGLQLVSKIKNRRKRRTNSFESLRMRGKRPVRKYFIHKTEELPVFVKYTHGKLLKRANKKVRILVKQDSKTLHKTYLKQGTKDLIALSNEYHCLNELITFLHHLPDAILEDRHYDIYVPSSDLTITYQIK